MKRALLAVLAIALLALAGCGPSEPAAPDISRSFIGGTAGLVASFPAGLPPEFVFDDGQMPFSVGIMLENAGESTVGVDEDSRNHYGYVQLLGFPPEEFGKQPFEMRKDFSEAGLLLNGAHRAYDGSIIAGEQSLILFEDLAYINDRFGNVPYTIRANLCYDYRTYSDTKICFKDNVLENAFDDTICTLDGAKQVQNSGGPVQVTSVTQNPAGSDRIQVTFTVENVGSGFVFAPSYIQQQDGNAYTSFGELDACVFTAGANPHRDVVEVEITLGSLATGEIINCPLLGGDNWGTLRMYGGAPATLTCTVTTLGREGSRIFTDDLHIDMAYTYLDWIETPILIRDQNVGFVERGTDRNSR